MKTILNIFGFFLVPYIVFYDWIRGGVKGNSGHTAGIGEGLMILAAMVSGSIQLFIFLIALILFFIL